MGFSAVEVGVAKAVPVVDGRVQVPRGVGDGGRKRGVEALGEEEPRLVAHPGEAVDPVRGGGAGEALAQVGREVVAVAREQVVQVALPHVRHGVDELGDLVRRQRRAADGDGLAEAGVRRGLRRHREHARVRVRMAAVAVLLAVHGHAAVVQPHAHVVEVPVDGRHRVGVVRVQEVVDVELDRLGGRHRSGRRRVYSRGRRDHVMPVVERGEGTLRGKGRWIGGCVRVCGAKMIRDR